MDISSRYHALITPSYPWFDAQWGRVTTLFKEEKLPHALLINGAKGMGKLHFASTIAKLVLCQDAANSTACGQCKSCQLFVSSGHPDLYHLSPEDDNGQIKVDQVRDLSHFMHSTAQQGGYRVVILNPAEAMNPSAANALLKTLEEPGKKSLLLLLADQLGQVMPTIKSRCQRIDCPAPDARVAIDWLQKKLPIEEADARQLLSVVHGSPLLALTFKERGDQSLRAEFINGLKNILQQKATAIETAAKFIKFDIILVLSWMQSLLIDVAKIHSTQNQASLTNNDMRKMLSALSKRTHLPTLYLLYDKIQCHRQALLAHQNPNKQLLLEDLLLDWKNLI